MTLRILLLRLLLLAAFFHAAVGMPLHERMHLAQGLAMSAQETADTRAEGEPDSATEAHGLCAWCAAYAAQGTAPVARAAFEVGPAPRSPAAWPPRRAFVPAGGHGRFAARDPPALPG